MICRCSGGLLKQWVTCVLQELPRLFDFVVVLLMCHSQGLSAIDSVDSHSNAATLVNMVTIVTFASCHVVFLT